MISQDLHGQRFSFEGNTYDTRLSGLCQAENAAVAVKALEALGEMGFPMSREQMQEGIVQASWPGRFTLLRENPAVILDGAHNPQAARQLAASLEKCFAGKKLVYVMGMFRDKDYRQVASIMAPLAYEILTVETPKNPRALPADELARAVREFHPRVTAASSLGEAAALALERAGADGVVAVFGSLSFLGEISGFFTLR